MTPESEEEHQPTRTRGRRRRAQPTRPSSPILEDTPSSSEDDLPPLTNSITAPQPPTRRNDGINPSGRISPTQEALLIAQESKSWDFMMSQMADWEERQQSWKKFRDGIERKFYSGRRMGLGLHGIIGWSPFHGHSKSSREERKEEKKLRGRKRAVSSSAAQGGRGWRRRVAGLAV
ncbi:hypothetical protein KEM55_008658 [Ascosphaera atra]|nr:hypothetical protein KEM55_008658 [Ascosphaera atra]